MNKIEFIELLRNDAKLSLHESKRIKDRIVDGEIIEIVVSENICDFIIDQSFKFGVEAMIVD